MSRSGGRESDALAQRYVFTQKVLTVERRECGACGRALAICDHRFHRIFTLTGPVELVCKLVHFPYRACPAARVRLVTMKHATSEANSSIRSSI